jgi:hypothetical protein
LVLSVSGCIVVENKGEGNEEMCGTIGNAALYQRCCTFSLV